MHKGPLFLALGGERSCLLVPVQILPLASLTTCRTDRCQRAFLGQDHRSNLTLWNLGLNHNTPAIGGGAEYLTRLTQERLGQRI